MKPHEIKIELTENTAQFLSDYFISLAEDVKNEFIVIAQCEGIEVAKQELEDDFYSFQGIGC